MEYKKGLISILIIANLLLSSYLIYQDITKIEGFCLTGQGCKIVQNSQYSSILGIKLVYLGFIFFIVLLLAHLLTINYKIKRNYFVILSAVGAILSIYFLFLQFFVIKAICSTCLVIDFFTIIIFIISVINSKK